MTNWGAVMREPEIHEQGKGERAEKTRSRRFWGTLIVLFVAGGIIGGIHGFLTRGNWETMLPAGWAIFMAGTWLISVTAGTWYFFRSIDELEMRDNLWSGTVAVYFYCITYPTWYFLWKGALVPEPSHELLFLGTMFVMAAAYIGKKIQP